ncbi:alpha/beta hydrolase [Aerococcaceae bacterium NML180378]|nr:alpha/beta hydrolase [Aerococcaceae bacterium NML180378]
MIEKVFATALGNIHYWVRKHADNSVVTLVFLPGLTADHRLFDQQVGHFKSKYNIFVWDAPGHANSYPFDLTFNLLDVARWLEAILTEEKLVNPIIIGQSMGGYIGQAYSELFPDKLCGFVAIDSAPLQRQYVTRLEIELLKRTEPIYKYYPWWLLLKQAPKAVATSVYGRQLMLEMMQTYDGNQPRYAALAGHGYRMLAEAMEADLSYQLVCPALLICGKKDRAGSCVRYNKAWHKRTGLPIVWLEGAGHNSNTDAPQQVNALIGKFVQQVHLMLDQ